MSLITVKDWPIKDPGEKRRLGFKWKQAENDAITNSVWDIPSGLIGTNGAINGIQTSILIEGGVDGVEYTVKNTVTLTSGQIFVRRVTLKVELR